MFANIRKVIPFAVAAGLVSSPVAADEVTLTSLDGRTTFSGDLVSFDGEKYVIQTILGELSIDALQVACQGEACPSLTGEAAVFSIAGSKRLVGELFPNLISDFGASFGGEALSEINPNGPGLVTLTNEAGDNIAEISLSTGNSSDGLSEMLAGNAKLAITTRPISENERSEFINAGLGDLTSDEQQRIIALDGLVIVTAKNNPVRAVAEQDLAKIFSGQVTNWSQIGGPNAPINIYVRDPKSGTGTIFDQLVMNPAGASIASNANIMDVDSAVTEAVSKDPLGIGVTSLSESTGAKTLAIRGVCGIQVPATPFTIKTEEYPLTRRIFAYTPENNVPAELTRMLDFLDTDEANQAILDAGYVDLGVSYETNNEQGLRYLAAVMPTDVEINLPQLRSMTGELMSSDRMSVTYRFALGSSQLDARARADIDRLATLLSTGDLTNKELLLIGYTDSIGNGASNVSLSQQRAREVRDALIAAAPQGSLDDLPIRALGFGEISPLSCNETDNGRRINRRVEVWLRDLVTVSQ